MIEGQINLSRTEVVIYGAGCVSKQLPTVLEQRNLDRVFLLSTPSLVRNGRVAQLETTLGGKMVGSFYESAPHTPRKVAARAAQTAKDANANVLIALGGSSVVDLAKAVALILAEGTNLDDFHVQFSPETGLKVPVLAKPKIPQIAIPTTLSGAEYTYAAAISDEERGEKHLYVDPQFTPKVIFQDSELCAATPASLWASTGMKIFADGVEAFSSPRAIPYTNGMAVECLNILLNELPASIDSSNLPARQRCLNAAFLIMSVAANSSLGLVAGLRHQLGAHQGVSHGNGSTIVLPHVMHWNMSDAGTRYAILARRLGISDSKLDVQDAGALISSINNLVASLDIPTKLSDVGVSKDALPEIAEHVTHDFVVASNPRQVTKSFEVLDVLNAAY